MKQAPNRRRALWAAVLLFLLPVLLALPVGAEEGAPDYREQYEALLEGSGADGLFSLIPEGGRELLEENGVTGAGQGSLLDIDAGKVFGSLWGSVLDALGRPAALFTTCVGIVLLCALLASLRSSFSEGSSGKVFSAVSVVCAASAVIFPVSELIRSSAGLIRSMSDFMLTFVPVYTGIVTASGQPVSAAAYNASLLGAAQVVSRVASTVLVPLLAIYMALCLIGSASSEISVEGIARAVKNIVVTTLGILLTIFVGLLSVQGTVAAAADTVTLKTVKFAAGAFLPVVGGAVSEALNAVQGCMGVVKACVGGFGVLAVAAAFLPEIIAILLTQVSLRLSAAVGETLGVKPLASLLRSASSVLSLLLGILVVFAMLLIVSVSVMLAMTGGSG